MSEMHQKRVDDRVRFRQLQEQRRAEIVAAGAQPPLYLRMEHDFAAKEQAEREAEARRVLEQRRREEIAKARFGSVDSVAAGPDTLTRAALTDLKAESVEKKIAAFQEAQAIHLSPGSMQARRQQAVADAWGGAGDDILNPLVAARKSGGGGAHKSPLFRQAVENSHASFNYLSNDPRTLQEALGDLPFINEDSPELTIRELGHARRSPWLPSRPAWPCLPSPAAATIASSGDGGMPQFKQSYILDYVAGDDWASEDPMGGKPAGLSPQAINPRHPFRQNNPVRPKQPDFAKASPARRPGGQRAVEDVGGWGEGGSDLDLARERFAAGHERCVRVPLALSARLGPTGCMPLLQAAEHGAPGPAVRAGRTGGDARAAHRRGEGDGDCRAEAPPGTRTALGAPCCRSPAASEAPAMQVIQAGLRAQREEPTGVRARANLKDALALGGRR